MNSRFSSRKALVDALAGALVRSSVERKRPVSVPPADIDALLDVLKGMGLALVPADLNDVMTVSAVQSQLHGDSVSHSARLAIAAGDYLDLP